MLVPETMKEGILSKQRTWKIIKAAVVLDVTYQENTLKTNVETENIKHNAHVSELIVPEKI